MATVKLNSIFLNLKFEPREPQQFLVVLRLFTCDLGDCLAESKFKRFSIKLWDYFGAVSQFSLLCLSQFKSFSRFSIFQTPLCVAFVLHASTSKISRGNDCLIWKWNCTKKKAETLTCTWTTAKCPKAPWPMNMHGIISSELNSFRLIPFNFDSFSSRWNNRQT